MRGCCDDFGETNCVGGERCDSEFFYCLMPLGGLVITDDIVSSLPERDITTRADQLGCLETPTALRSDVDTDGESLNFLADTFLGLPNPMEFRVTASRWQVKNYILYLHA